MEKSVILAGRAKVKMYDLETVKIVTDRIVQACKSVANCPLKKIWLYGSITRRFFQGRDIDLVFEVDQAAFDSYAHQCATNGTHPLSADPREHSHGMYFEGFSPKVLRSAAALAVVGVTIEGLDLDIPKAALDIVCLPEKWDNKNEVVYHELRLGLQKGHDKNYLENVMHSVVPIFSRV